MIYLINNEDTDQRSKPILYNYGTTNISNIYYTSNVLFYFNVFVKYLTP